MWCGGAGVRANDEADGVILDGMNIALTITEEDPAVVRVAGEIDILTAPTLRRILLDLVAAGFHRLLVDLDDIDFIDSAGLDALAAVLDRARARQGSLGVVCSNPRTVRLLRIASEDLVVYG